MQYATEPKKMYLLRFAQLILLLGRKQAETVEKTSNGNKLKTPNNWRVVR